MAEMFWLLQAEQQESLAFVLEEAMKLKYATYLIMVRSTPEFCAELEEEVIESMLLLRAELSVQTGLESVSGILLCVTASNLHDACFLSYRPLWLSTFFEVRRWNTWRLFRQL
jgi:hypothetical protein